jgi:hypothetical protein
LIRQWREMNPSSAYRNARTICSSVNVIIQGIFPQSGAYDERKLTMSLSVKKQYLDQEGKVVYTSKDGRTSKSFPALEWLANLCSHIPNSFHFHRRFGRKPEVKRDRAGHVSPGSGALRGRGG